MKSVCIIGGGLAGLASAAFLSEKFEVSLFERTANLGGRAKSFFNHLTNSYYDNGQHLLAGAYKNTIDFLNIINAKDNFYFQKNLSIHYLLPGGKPVNFSLSNPESKILKVFDFLKFNLFNFSEKISILSFLNTVRKLDSDEYSGYSAFSLLQSLNQSAKINKYFWDLIIVSTLNCSSESASAKAFIDIIQTLFFRESSNSVLIFPKYDLFTSYIKPSVLFLEKNGAKIFLNKKIIKINFFEDSVDSVETDNEKYKFDEYIIAAASYDLVNLLGNRINSIFPDATDLLYSPIISINLWLQDFHRDELFYYLLDSPLQWIFIKEKSVSIVISDAELLIAKSKEELLQLTIKELKKYFPDFRFESKMVDYKILKEKRATFIPSGLSYDIRPFQNTVYRNLLISGDYTNTGLPSTIESALISSKICSEIIKKKY